MKRSAGVVAGLVLALAVAGPVSASPINGSTVPTNAPVSGATLYVDASLTTNYPVVAYEFAIQNECAFPHRTGSSLQHDDIVTWTFESGGIPHAILPVYLQSVPSGSACKVFLVRNNTVVKGSTTSYTVG